MKRYKPLARWVALTLLLVSVMRSAANHFFPTSPTTQNLDLSKLLKEKKGTVFHIPSWWNPQVTLPDSAAATDDSSVVTENSSTSTPAATPNPGASSSFGSGKLNGPLGTLPIGNGPTASSVPAIGTSLKGLPSLPNGFGTQARPAAPGMPSFKLSSSQSTSSNHPGNPVLPVDRSTQLSSSLLLGKADLGFTLPSSNSSKPMYAVLGLGQSSTPSSSSDDAGNDLTKTGSGELNFSLSGSLSATPTYTFSGVAASGASGADSVIPLTTPEPGTGAMLLSGVFALASRRRRRTA